MMGRAQGRHVARHVHGGTACGGGACRGLGRAAAGRRLGVEVAFRACAVEWRGSVFIRNMCAGAGVLDAPATALPVAPQPSGRGRSSRAAGRWG